MIFVLLSMLFTLETSIWLLLWDKGLLSWPWTTLCSEIFAQTSYRVEILRISTFTADIPNIYNIAVYTLSLYYSYSQSWSSHWRSPQAEKQENSTFMSVSHGKWSLYIFTLMNMSTHTEAWYIPYTIQFLIAVYTCLGVAILLWGRV